MNAQTGARSVYFPLASNANSLVAGAGVRQVRSRLKISSVLYDQVLVEAGQLLLQAGPNGSFQTRSQDAEGPAGSGTKWQSAQARGRAQRASFSLSMATETTPGVASTGPFREVLNSPSSICWNPTFAPFRAELPAGCDWIIFGTSSGSSPEVLAASKAWKSKDGRSDSLLQLVPEQFVRSQIVSNIADDLAVGLGGNWDVSTDGLHSRVFRARFEERSLFREKGFALPILIPNVTSLSWDDIQQIRRHKAVRQLRDNLLEVESEALAAAGGDIERAVHLAYENQIAPAQRAIDAAFPQATLALGEVVVGVAAGYATMGLGAWGGVVGAIPGAALSSLAVVSSARAHGRRKWIGAMQTIQKMSIDVDG